MLDFFSHVANLLHTHNPHNRKVVVGVSGGIDSMVLLKLIGQCKAQNNLEVVVAHVNHNLRGVESDDDERFVVSICESMGISCRTTSVNVMELNQEKGMGIEAAARVLRYQFFTQVVIEEEAQLLLLAHNADDVAETMLMNLARGSGVRGLAAFPEVKNLHGTHAKLLRPLRSFSRSDILKYAESNNVFWREDSSNTNLSYLRNAVRSNLLPMFKNVFAQSAPTNMLQSAELLADALQIVTDVTKDAARAVLSHSDEGVHIHLAPFQEYSKPLQRELIRVALHGLYRAELAESNPPSYVDTQRAFSLVEATVGSRATLHDKVIAVRERTSITLRFDQGEVDFFEVAYEFGETIVRGSRTLQSTVLDRTSVNVTTDAQVAYLDADTITYPLRWRTWENGDRIVPLGMSGSVLVSDLLTNAKVPNSKRRSVTVIEDAHGLIWVCGLRIADRVRVTHSTKSIAVIRIS
ncbi:MAG: tRNA lysidine(34) synthetase TilS [Ignavibacteria bacterium]|nr:tRNA lysidine(34) synthetase TilS [Ignavibacteria bacterium]